MKKNKLLFEQTVIETLCKLCPLESDYHKCKGYPETSTWCDELVALRALPPAEPLRETCWGCNCPKIEEAEKSRWIPADEPVPNKEVLCCDKYGNIMIGFVYESYASETGFHSVSEESFMYDVTAWMPLPEPYKKTEVSE